MHTWIQGHNTLWSDVMMFSTLPPLAWKFPATFQHIFVRVSSIKPWIGLYFNSQFQVPSACLQHCTTIWSYTCFVICWGTGCYLVGLEGLGFMVQGFRICVDFTLAACKILAKTNNYRTYKLLSLKPKYHNLFCCHNCRRSSWSLQWMVILIKAAEKKYITPNCRYESAQNPSRN